MVYVSGLRISRLTLAETVCGWYCISGQFSIYKGGAAEIFKDVDMIMTIYQFKRMFMLKEKNWDRYSWYQSSGFRIRIRPRTVV